MPRLKLILALVFIAWSASAGTRYIDYPNKPALASNDLFLISEAGTGNKNVSQGQLQLQSGKVDVRTFGAYLDGIHDDTPAFHRAIAYLGQSGGTVFYPPSTPCYNLVISNVSNLTIEGSSHSIRPYSSTNYASAFDPSRPAIQIGGDNVSEVTDGIIIKNVRIDGNAGSDNVGVKITGGAYHCKLEDCELNGSRTNLIITGGTNQYTSVITIQGCHLVAYTTDANSRNVVYSYGSTYLTDVKLVDVKMNGPTLGYLEENFGVLVKEIEVYKDGSAGHGGYLRYGPLLNSFATYDETGVHWDFGGVACLIEDTGTLPLACYVQGLYHFNRYYQYTNGVIQGISGGGYTASSFWYAPNLFAPSVHRGLGFIDMNQHTNFAPSYANQIYASSGTLNLQSASSAIAMSPGNGVAYVYGGTNSSGTAQVQVSDTVNSKSGRFYIDGASGDSINIRPNAADQMTYLRDGGANIALSYGVTNDTTLSSQGNIYMTVPFLPTSALTLLTNGTFRIGQFNAGQVTCDTNNNLFLIATNRIYFRVGDWSVVPTIEGDGTLLLGSGSHDPGAQSIGLPYTGRIAWARTNGAAGQTTFYVDTNENFNITTPSSTNGNIFLNAGGGLVNANPAVIKAGGYQSSDGSAGKTTNFSTASTITWTVKNGLVTGVSY